MDENIYFDHSSIHGYLKDHVICPLRYSLSEVLVVRVKFSKWVEAFLTTQGVAPHYQKNLKTVQDAPGMACQRQRHCTQHVHKGQWPTCSYTGLQWFAHCWCSPHCWWLNEVLLLTYRLSVSGTMEYVRSPDTTRTWRTQFSCRTVGSCCKTATSTISLGIQRNK